MPLEGRRWVDDPAQQDIVAVVARGEVTMAGSDRGSRRWQVLIMQPDPIDVELIAAATAEVAGKKRPARPARLEYIRVGGVPVRELLHIGPYAAEAPSIAALHEAIAEAGCRPRGRHHEIYLGDPRRSAPEKLRTIIRHPVEPGEAWHDRDHRRDRHRRTSGRGLRLRRRPAERAGLQPAHGAIREGHAGAGREGHPVPLGGQVRGPGSPR